MIWTRFKDQEPDMMCVVIVRDTAGERFKATAVVGTLVDAGHSGVVVSPDAEWMYWNDYNLL